MKDSALQLTIGELRAIFTSPRAWAGMGIAIVILGFSGPFQTFQVLSLGPRLVYWAVMGVATFAVGSFFGTWAAHKIESWSLPGILMLVLVGICAGVPVAVTVMLINAAAFASGVGSPREVFVLALYSIGIAMGISGMFAIFRPQREKKEKLQEKPRILERLPAEKRAGLVSLSVQDHYVEVATGKGRHLVLMRLSDAMKEAGEQTGFQIHRSHWVARKAIKSVQRVNGRVSVLTSRGEELPVSRTYLAKLRQEGFLS